MRILHVTDHYAPVLGGIETHVAALAARQAAQGDDVTVLTCGPAAADGRVAIDTGPVRVLRVRSTPEGRAVDPTGFDLVHAHSSVVAPFTAPVAAAAARHGVPTVVTVHSLWNRLGPVPGLFSALSGLATAPVLWTAVSHVAARSVSHQLPRRPEVLVLPNAVDVEPRAMTPVRGPDEPVRLVSTMRLARRKRPVPLVAMMATLLRRTDVPVTLTLIGDGPLREHLESRIRRHGLSDVVTLTGRVEPAQVTALLAAADVYIAPALLESFGLAALEARAVGLPVVGYAASGLRDFVRPGLEGFLCDSDDQVVATLRRLVEDPDLRSRLAEHNRSTPTAMTWARTLARHEAAYARARERVPARALFRPAVG